MLQIMMSGSKRAKPTVNKSFIVDQSVSSPLGFYHFGCEVRGLGKAYPVSKLKGGNTRLEYARVFVASAANVALTRRAMKRPHRRWSDASVTFWADGGCGALLCRSSSTMSAHRLLLASQSGRTSPICATPTITRTSSLGAVLVVSLWLVISPRRGRTHKQSGTQNHQKLFAGQYDVVVIDDGVHGLFQSCEGQLVIDESTQFLDSRFGQIPLESQDLKIG